MNYYYSTDGTNTQGPTTLEELSGLFSRGGLPATTQVCAVGGEVWQPISAVLHPGTAPLTPPPLPQTGDATGGLIPYKNPHALIAYYLGIFGLFPAIGLLLAIPAFILGIMGLKKRKLNPVIKGAAHAWIGIILGAVSVGYHTLIIIAIVLAPKPH